MATRKFNYTYRVKVWDALDWRTSENLYYEIFDTAEREAYDYICEVTGLDIQQVWELVDRWDSEWDIQPDPALEKKDLGTLDGQDFVVTLSCEIEIPEKAQDG